MLRRTSEEEDGGDEDIKDRCVNNAGLLLTLCSLKYRPQALHTGSPLAFLRHSVVVVVWQFAHDVPARLAADCTRTHREREGASHDHSPLNTQVSSNTHHIQAVWNIYKL